MATPGDVLTLFRELIQLLSLSEDMSIQIQHLTNTIAKNKPCADFLKVDQHGIIGCVAKLCEAIAWFVAPHLIYEPEDIRRYLEDDCTLILTKAQWHAAFSISCESRENYQKQLSSEKEFLENYGLWDMVAQTM